MIIYNVMNSEEWVGTFYCGSFSTREKAEDHMRLFQERGEGSELYVEEYLVDSE